MMLIFPIGTRPPSPTPPTLSNNNKLDKNDNFYLESQSSSVMKIMFSNSSTHAD